MFSKRFQTSNINVPFSTYRPHSCKHLSHHTPVRPYERIDCCDRCIGHRNNTGPGPSSSTTLSWPWANVLHQTCIAGLI